MTSSQFPSLLEAVRQALHCAQVVFATAWLATDNVFVAGSLEHEAEPNGFL